MRSGVFFIVRGLVTDTMTTARSRNARCYAISLVQRWVRAPVEAACFGLGWLPFLNAASNRRTQRHGGFRARQAHATLALSLSGPLLCAEPPIFCRGVIARHCDKWADLLLPTALWMREAPPEFDLCWRELVIVAKALADGRDMTKIGLMCDIAQRTIAVLGNGARA